jgi:hypothetical protein
MNRMVKATPRRSVIRNRFSQLLLLTRRTWRPGSPLQFKLD